MSYYAWIIDQDNLHKQDPDIFPDAANTTGPSDVPESFLQALSDNPVKAIGYMPKVYNFYMYDDDNELYFTGRMVKSSEGYDEEAFAGPLYDFGGPGYGCTRIEYDGMPGAFEY